MSAKTSVSKPQNVLCKNQGHKKQRNLKELGQMSKDYVCSTGSIFYGYINVYFHGEDHFFSFFFKKVVTIRERETRDSFWDCMH